MVDNIGGVVDYEMEILEGGDLLVEYKDRAAERNAMIVGKYPSTGGRGAGKGIVFWGKRNDLPDQRELLISQNSVVPQIIATKRNIIVGGGLMVYSEEYINNKRIITEHEMPAVFEDFIQLQEELYGGLEELANDLLKHGQYFVEYGLTNEGKPAYLKPHAARCVRAEHQNDRGEIPRWWLNGQWSRYNDPQKLAEVKNLQDIANYNPLKKQSSFLMRGADKLLGGPYYYHPHYEGSCTWIETANRIPMWHLSNIDNGFAPRFIIKVPQDYYLNTLSVSKQQDKPNLANHLKQAKKNFKERMNAFLSGANNAGRSIILTTHQYKNIQREFPGVEIIPLEFDLKDDSMLALYDASNTASTSAHGTPPVLAGIATGATLSSGSEVRNLYNFYQIAAAPSPRRILKRPYWRAWRDMGLKKQFPSYRLGFRNIQLETTDKTPSGRSTVMPEANPETNNEE
ncbi:MAG: hypothetical protein AAF828_06680 [Bacteroidota bacterium]